jgi:CRP-like cAMP-binding protein
MSLENEVKLLRNISMFSNIEVSKLKLLAFASDWLTFEPEQILFHQGEMGDAAYVIIEGEVDILVDGDDGPMLISKRGKNDVIGEIAIFCDVPRTATVRASSEVVTLRITKDVFMQIVNGHPAVAVEIIRILADRLAKNTQELSRVKEALAHLQEGRS